MPFPPRAPLKTSKPTERAISRYHGAAIAFVVMLAVAPVLAADLTTLEGLRAFFPTHAGWTVLAGLGLLAVAVAAYSVRRPRVDKPVIDDTPLGRMRNDVHAVTLVPSTDASPPPSPSLPIERAAGTQQTMGTSPDTGMLRNAAVSLASLSNAVSASAHAHPSAPANGSQLFLALQHVDLSIDVLRRHLQREPRPMPAVWLMLLDLCRTHGREQAFQELAVEFHLRFNVCTPAWEGFPPGREDPGLEAYPRLIKEITLAWGTHECRRLLERLLYDNRGAQRKGFTLNAYNDLIALRRAADAVLDSIDKVPTLPPKATDIEVDDLSMAAPSVSHPDTSPLVSDLESQLERDLRTEVAPQSAIEREHPALAGMIAREWGNAAMSARLCDMLARGGDSTHALSHEASEEIDLLRGLAERLSPTNGVAIASNETD